MSRMFIAAAESNGVYESYVTCTGSQNVGREFRRETWKSEDGNKMRCAQRLSQVGIDCPESGCSHLDRMLLAHYINY